MTMKQLRAKAGLRAEDVASKLGIAVSTVRNWEQGRTEPTVSVSILVKLLALYNCTIDELHHAVSQTRNLSNNN